MNNQCKFCIHSAVCAYKEHYEDAVKLYENARHVCSKYPWFKCDITCVQYLKAESVKEVTRNNDDSVTLKTETETETKTETEESEVK